MASRDVPPVDPSDRRTDANLDEQTVHAEEPGPGASKEEARRRMENQVRLQRARTRAVRDEGPEEEQR